MRVICFSEILLKFLVTMDSRNLYTTSNNALFSKKFSATESNWELENSLSQTVNILQPTDSYDLTLPVNTTLIKKFRETEKKKYQTKTKDETNNLNVSLNDLEKFLTKNSNEINVLDDDAKKTVRGDFNENNSSIRGTNLTKSKLLRGNDLTFLNQTENNDRSVTNKSKPILKKTVKDNHFKSDLKNTNISQAIKIKNVSIASNKTIGDARHQRELKTSASNLNRKPDLKNYSVKPLKKVEINKPVPKVPSSLDNKLNQRDDKKTFGNINKQERKFTNVKTANAKK